MVLRLMFDLFNFKYSIKKYYDIIDELLITELHILYVFSEVFITSFANLRVNIIINWVSTPFVVKINGVNLIYFRCSVMK